MPIYVGLTFKCLAYQLDCKQDSAGRLIYVIILVMIFYENSSCVNRIDGPTGKIKLVAAFCSFLCKRRRFLRSAHTVCLCVLC